VVKSKTDKARSLQKREKNPLKELASGRQDVTARVAGKLFLEDLLPKEI